MVYWRHGARETVGGKSDAWCPKHRRYGRVCCLFKLYKTDDENNTLIQRNWEEKLNKVRNSQEINTQQAKQLGNIEDPTPILYQDVERDFEETFRRLDMERI